MPGWCGITTAHEIENFIYRGVAITIEGTLYMRLLVSPSQRTGGGTETNYGSYARLAFVRDTTTIWTVAPSGGLLTNGVQIAFPSPSTTGNGDLVWFDFVDTPSGTFTKVYNGGPISPADPVEVGKPPTFAPGKCQITF